ncbi:hypothetical protein GCM10027022_10010 [Alpinimonas psychrophila]|uniref:Pimeloyl-ACP methyl ester carboxylesterase n=1 Tax=Alpinimonas psychrophila TaxID=748908 RepID=A0A7W3JT93_9MICO|nr:alpha/beta hydrolase [Alpinimonas psychrophila]MBA8828824.1 pimeloyl-ACP methyl ester carboxylesterase [Alpinimonas psychrophila]
MSIYRKISVPVTGGDLVTGEWVPETITAGTVLAVHGITASHMTWPLVANALPHVRFIAPDLRGRGGSRSLPGPWGMPAHAEDLVRVLDAAGVDRAVIVGHSMGAFAAVTLAHTHPDRVERLVLIDGGLPLPIVEKTSDDGLPQALLGPAAARLSMAFPDREAYRQFWRAHPAFAGQWNSTVEAYVDYDLVGDDSQLHASSSIDAVMVDSQQLNGGTDYFEALASMPSPIHFLRAPRGLLNQLPGLYSPEQMVRWKVKLPNLTVHDVSGVNHYTIVMSERGADAVVEVINDVMSTPQPSVPQPQ